MASATASPCCATPSDGTRGTTAGPLPRAIGYRDPSAATGLRLQLQLAVVNGRVWQLALERFSVAQATAQEPWPRWYGYLGFDALRQQAPKLGVMPTEVVAGTVSVAADASAQSPYLGDQLIAVQSIKIAINIHGSRGYAAHSAASDPDLRKRMPAATARDLHRREGVARVRQAGLKITDDRAEKARRK